MGYANLFYFRVPPFLPSVLSITSARSPRLGMKIIIRRMIATTTIIAITVPIMPALPLPFSALPAEDAGGVTGVFVADGVEEDMGVDSVSVGETVGVCSFVIMSETISEANSDAPPVAPPIFVSGIFSVINPAVSANADREKMAKITAATNAIADRRANAPALFDFFIIML